MAVTSLAYPKYTFVDANGKPLAGGLVYTYQAGTSTLATTWTDSSGSTANTNPVVLDVNGQCTIWGLTTQTYDLGVHNSGDVLQYTVQNISGAASYATFSASSGSSLVGFLQAGAGAVARTVQDKERDWVSVKDFGAVCDGVADDTAAITNGLTYLASIGGGVLEGVPGMSLRITSGLTIASANVIFDLMGGQLVADFVSGNAVTVGDGVTAYSGLGIRNGRVTTANTSTTLNGVVFKKNVRRSAQYGGLYISNFKGMGLQFEQLNWSIQNRDAPIVESCGVNLDINDNGNGITIAGAGLSGATTYNARLRGTVGVTFVGGYNQFAGTAGALLDTGTVGAMQISVATAFLGVYMEGNGTSHIVGNNGRGLMVHGCYMNCSGMTGDAIALTGWNGASIEGNTPSGNSGRNFVNADSASSLIRVGRQNITTTVDAVIGGSMNAYVSDAFPAAVTSLPASSTLNLGSQFLLTGSGTGANRQLPYVCTTVASATRQFRRMALEPRKQSAQAATSPYTPNLGSLECFDLSIPNAGLTINAPTGPYDDGDQIIFMFKQGGAPVANITWDAVYKTDLSTTTLTANSYGSVTFRYSAGRSLWIQVGKMEWKA